MANKLLSPVTADFWRSAGPATREHLLPLLAKTADGVTIEPGTTVYRAAGNFVMGRTAIDVTAEGFTAEHGSLTGRIIANFYGDRFYSTPDAAFEAADAEAGQHA
jgi:hypothetical protein